MTTWFAGRTDPHEVWEIMEQASGAHAYDVGANGGVVAAMLALHFGIVDAFEPAVESYEHMICHHPANVHCHNLAVSDTTGTIELAVNSQAIRSGELVTGSSLEFSWGEQVCTRSVNAVTLDRAAQVFGTPDWIKIDTEGHELAVVRGGPNLLADAGPTLLIEVHSEANGDAIVTELIQYRWRIIRHPGYRLNHPGYREHYYMVGEAA